MAESDAIIGYGTEFWLGNGASPSVLTEIAEVKSINPPNASTDTVEVTHMKSPDRAKEYIGGLTDYGDISFTINYVAGSPSDVLLTAARGKKRQAKIVIPSNEDGSDQWQFTFPAILTGYAKDIPVGDVQTATVTLRVAGAVVEAAVP